MGRCEIGGFLLADEVLTIELEVSSNSIAHARELAFPLINAWQLEAEIRRHPLRGFRFAFWKADVNGVVADRAEHPPEPLEQQKEDEGALIFTASVYPPPPQTRFMANIRSAWVRYRMAAIATDIGEPIQSAAYYALTIAEQNAGGRRNAASVYQVDLAILHKLGELTSPRGSEITARKAAGSTASPLTREEVHWIDSAIRWLFLHYGAVEAGYLPDPITMDDLPELP